MKLPIKWRKKKYINVRTIPKSATIVLEWDKIAPSARLLSWLGTDISINSSGVKQIWNHSNFLKAKETCVFIKQMNCFLRFVSFSSIFFFDRQYISLSCVYVIYILIYCHNLTVNNQWPNHFTKTADLSLENELNRATFYWSPCTKPEKKVIYVC
jgi:hypothetical protein